MKILLFFRKNIFPILILLFEIILFLTNFKTNTFLVGWDNLFPELNFPANLQRSFFASWQQYRGLGLLDGMSFIANLPHWVFRYLLSLLLPQHLIRYCFFFLMHYLGGLGVYSLLSKNILKHQSSFKTRGIISFLAAIFYMFNLGTIQMFYCPFELFAIHFAFLPWLCLYLLNYLKTGSKKNLVWFTALSFLSIPQAHVPTIFLVYLIPIFFILFFFLIHKQSFIIKRFLIIISAIFCLNAFWGFPYIYSTILNARVITQAKINQMSSQDVYLENKRRGNFQDLISLKGFILDTVELVNRQDNDYIMKSWRQHVQKPIFKISTIIFSFFALIGILTTVVKKQKFLYPFLGSILVCSFFLASNMPIIGPLNDLLRTKFPIFGEAFRFSLTKFIILFSLCYSIFLVHGLGRLIEFIKTISTRLVRKYLPTALPLLLVILTIGYSLPAFKGDFFFDNLRTQIPNEYFQTIEFFKSQSINTRVAILPQPTYWSWRFYNWGSRGSGFLWYGIPQPSLDRAFDPWSDKNENNYWEISYALYSQNKKLLESILEKYQINWLLLDKNIINPSSPKALDYDQTTLLLTSLEKINLSADFGQIQIYHVDLDTPVDNFVFLAQDLPTIAPQYHWNNYDFSFLENSHYLSTIGLSNNSLNKQTAYYPFRSLFTNRSQKEIEFDIKETSDYFIFQHSLSESLSNHHLEIPPIKEELIWINSENLGDQTKLIPEVRYDGKQISVIVPKIKGYYSTIIDPSNQIPALTAKNCNQFNQGETQNQTIQENGNSLLRLTSTNSYNCSPSFILADFPHQLAYLISVESRHLQGKSLLFWLENLNTYKPDIDTYLSKDNQLTTSYFIQPPMKQDGLGYSLHFDNISIGQVKTVNDLGKIQVNPIPYHFLTSLVLKPTNFENQSKTYRLKVVHPNPSLYWIPLNQFDKHLDQSSLTIALSQAYHQGWQAYVTKNNIPNLLAPIFGKKINRHLLLNNWQNGWLIDNDQINEVNQKKIVIIFLPQILPYLGLIILFLFLVFLFLTKPKTTSSPDL